MTGQLQHYTWDQAAILHAWPPTAFEAVGIKAGTLRQWAARGHVTAVGIGPNGCKLYSFEEVARHARRTMSARAGNSGHMCNTGAQVE